MLVRYIIPLLCVVIPTGLLANCLAKKIHKAFGLSAAELYTLCALFGALFGLVGMTLVLQFYC